MTCTDMGFYPPALSFVGFVGEKFEQADGARKYHVNHVSSRELGVFTK